MVKVELPINLDNIECVTECWTFNRMLILKTSSYYEDWVASHYNLFVVNGRFHFEQLIYTPEMYDTILCRRQIRYFEMTESNIVDRFKQELRNGYYLNVMTKPNIADDWYHEIVLYGYDDRKEIFYAIGFEGYKFIKVQYSYQFIVDMLKEMKYYFLNEEPKRGLRLSEVFQYPISAFRLKEDYSVEACSFGAFHKLRTELNGKYFGEDVRNIDNWTYTGISCLVAWEDFLNEIAGGKSEFSSFLQIETIAKILHEHRKMMLISMKYLQKKWSKALKKEFADNILKYQECCKYVGKWKNMAIKYKMTNDKELLKKILVEIPSVYDKEYSCLDNLVNHCIDWDKFNEYYI